MSLLSVLTSSYSFGHYIQLVYSTLGPTSVIIFLISFAGLMAYVSSLPTNRTFTTRDVRMMGLGLFSYIMYFLSAPIMFWMFFFRFFQFWLFLLLYIFIIIPSLLNFRWLNRGWTYNDLKSFESKVRSRLSNFIELKFKKMVDMRILGTPILLIFTIFEVLIFLFANLIISLLAWILLSYILFMSLVEISYSYGVIRSFTDAKNLCFKLKDNTSINAFLISKDEDHYLILTEDGLKIVFSSQIVEIHPCNSSQNTLQHFSEGH